MPPHSLGSGTISFGLVSIPVRLYTAASTANVSFNQLHGVCGSRIRQQIFCPTCNRTVERNELVRGYEVTLHGETIALRLTSGKGDASLRGPFVVAGKPIRGSWEVKRTGN